MATDLAFTNGELIRKARLDAKLDQATLGAKLGVRAETVSSWENNHTEPTARQLKRIEHETGADWLWVQLRRHVTGLDLHQRVGIAS